MVTIENISKYLGTENVATWYFTREQSDYSDLFTRSFLSSYYQLTHKTGFVLPGIECYDAISRGEDSICSHIETLKLTKSHVAPILFFYLHQHLEAQFGENVLVCPSMMFINVRGKIEQKLISDINNPLSSEGAILGDVPVKINAFQNEISVQLNTDAFFPIIPYSERIDRLIGPLMAENIDNSELANLNAPRFNEFIRSFTKLLTNEGFTVEFENHYDADKMINKNGIVINVPL